MKHYKDRECERQQALISLSHLFDGAVGNGRFMGKERPFVLAQAANNLFSAIREDAQQYFRNNRISWWGGSKPSGHALSSQIACLNHLFLLRKDPQAVLSVLNGLRNEFERVCPIKSDEDKKYIAFEVVSKEQYLNESSLTRGSNCTSIDALIYAKHKSGEMWLILIEWKYTEHYSNQDKSQEDREGEHEKGLNGKGEERMHRYNELIKKSNQLLTPETLKGSLYYIEPFYQLMRQTLWAEQMIEHRKNEDLQAVNYLHVHVIPSENDELLLKEYPITQKGMEESWRSMLLDQSKYVIVDPMTFLAPIENSYPSLYKYLNTRYWQ